MTLIFCLFLSTTAGTAMAHPPCAGSNEIRPIDAFRLLFSEDQNKRMDDVLKQFEPEMRPLFGQLRQYRQELEAMFKSESATDQDLKAQIDKISGVEFQLAVKHAAMTRTIRKIATPEQLVKVDDMEADQMKSREEFFQEMGRERQGAKVK